MKSQSGLGSVADSQSEERWDGLKVKPKNCIIMGAGRSGTSLAAGLMSKAGYFMGDDLYLPTEANPKGFFEGPEINLINEEILERAESRGLWAIYSEIARFRPRRCQRWLTSFQLSQQFHEPADIGKRIKALVSREPYCFKDPRFSYTLPVWRPYLKDTLFICVFREPGSTAQSIVKECAEAKYLRNIKVSFSRALKIWKSSYIHILKKHRFEGEWCFVHFNQIIDGTAIARLGRLANAEVDYSFPDKTLKRSSDGRVLGADVENVYRELCELADYENVDSSKERRE